MGETPWTIFAFPSQLADARGLPLDSEAKRYFEALRALGLEIRLWTQTEIPGTTYFGIRIEDREFAERCIGELERRGEFVPGFAEQRAEFLFASITLNAN